MLCLSCTLVGLNNIYCNSFDKMQRQSSNPELLFKKRCKYIGSVAITTLSHEDRLHFVNDKMLEMKDGSKGIGVILIVTNEGIKALNEKETAVKFAHSISCIAFSTCLPGKKLFAYIARSKQSDGKSIIQAHIFRTKKGSHSQQLSAGVSNAFSIAYSRSETRRKTREQLFQSEAELQLPQSITAKRGGGKHWAKLEIAKGHDFSSHAVLARAKGVAPFEKIDFQKKQPLEKSEIDSPIILETKKNSSTTVESNMIDKTVSSNLKSSITDLSNIESSNAIITQAKKKISSSNTHEIVELNRKNQPIVMRDIKPRSKTLDIVSVSDKFSGLCFSDNKNVQCYENIQVPKNIQCYENVQNKDWDTENSAKLRTKSDVASSNSSSNFVSQNPLINTNCEMTSDMVLRNSDWFQPGFSREIAIEVLEHCSIGSFIIRDSMSHLGCYVMTVKVPLNIKSNGIANFLIEKTENNFYRIKGFSSTYPSLVDLVAFYGSVEQDLPCRLRLANNNPLFMENNLPNNIPEVSNLHIIDDDDYDEYDDPDYEYFNTTDEIMKELQCQ